MNQLNVSLSNQGIFELSGDLTFATIDRKTPALCDFNRIQGQIIIDLTAIIETDSAGLALLIEWLKQADTLQRQIEFRQLPPQLIALAE
ncbi:MAG: hypothetical protein RL637_276, partial [Pseudomonadota bacterium]